MYMYTSSKLLKIEFMIGKWWNCRYNNSQKLSRDDLRCWLVDKHVNLCTLQSEEMALQRALEHGTLSTELMLSSSYLHSAVKALSHWKLSFEIYESRHCLQHVLQCEIHFRNSSCKCKLHAGAGG